MSILGIQIIALFFGLFMFYLAYLSWKKNEINKIEMFFWAAVWTIFLIVTLFPSLLNNIIREVHVVRVMDFLMILTFMVLTFFVFRNRISNKKIETKIEELVRKISIKEFEGKKK